jgi:hypothetical protein
MYSRAEMPRGSAAHKYTEQYGYGYANARVKGGSASRAAQPRPTIYQSELGRSAGAVELNVALAPWSAVAGARTAKVRTMPMQTASVSALQRSVRLTANLAADLCMGDDSKLEPMLR